MPKAGRGKRDIQTHLKTNTVEANVLRVLRELGMSQKKSAAFYADFLSA
jgi:hypothetical protein